MARATSLDPPPRKVNHINNKEVDFLTAAEKILGGIGYIQMEDAVKPDGSFRWREDCAADREALPGKRAFERMTQNLKPRPQFSAGSKKKTGYLKDTGRAKISLYLVPCMHDHRSHGSGCELQSTNTQLPSSTWCLQGDLIILLIQEPARFGGAYRANYCSDVPGSHLPRVSPAGRDSPNPLSSHCKSTWG